MSIYIGTKHFIIGIKQSSRNANEENYVQSYALELLQKYEVSLACLKHILSLRHEH
jgi:hypothetical protein